MKILKTLFTVERCVLAYSQSGGGRLSFAGLPRLFSVRWRFIYLNATFHRGITKPFIFTKTGVPYWDSGCLTIWSAESPKKIPHSHCEPQQRQVQCHNLHVNNEHFFSNLVNVWRRSHNGVLYFVVMLDNSKAWNCSMSFTVFTFTNTYLNQPGTKAPYSRLKTNAFHLLVGNNIFIILGFLKYFQKYHHVSKWALLPKMNAKLTLNNK